MKINHTKNDNQKDKRSIAVHHAKKKVTGLHRSAKGKKKTKRSYNLPPADAKHIETIERTGNQTTNTRNKGTLPRRYKKLP
jgi:hypothetical protein